MAKGFDILLCYNLPSRFPSKLNSSGSTSTIGVAAGLPPKSLSILMCRKFIKRATLVTSAPTAASVYAYLMISAHDILGLARGNANANAWRYKPTIQCATHRVGPVVGYVDPKGGLRPLVQYLGVEGNVFGKTDTRSEQVRRETRKTTR